MIVDMIRNALIPGISICVFAGALAAEVELEAGKGFLSYTGAEGPGLGKHVVLLAGDEEYRSEETMPMLAKILAEKHGFRTTVLFSIDEDGTVNPKASESLAKSTTLDSADALVLNVRFRAWGDETMKRFQGAIDRGVPIIAIRTSTHAFNFPEGHKYEALSWNHPSGGFGKKVLGETWVSHWGAHKKEATLAKVEPSATRSPLLNGVGEIFGDTDVYEAAPPADAAILLRGYVLSDLSRTSELSTNEKETVTGKKQPVNDPAMPVVWSRIVKNELGADNKVLMTTMGSNSDFMDENLRRLVVNGVYWGLGLDVPEKADVEISPDYKPTPYGFEGFLKGKKAADFAH